MKNIGYSRFLVLCLLVFFCGFVVGCPPKIAIDKNMRPPVAIKIQTVPYVSQLPYLCGPASVEMILKFHGIEKYSQVQISSCDAQNTKGTHWPKLVDYINGNLNKDGIAAHTVYGDLGLLKKYVASGYPVLVRQWTNPGKSSRHYRVVVGYDDHTQMIIYHDPKVRANMEMDYQMFTDLWDIQVSHLEWSSKNLMIIIGKINGHQPILRLNSDASKGANRAIRHFRPYFYMTVLF